MCSAAPFQTPITKATTLSFAHPTTIGTANSCIKSSNKWLYQRDLSTPEKVSKIGRENKNEFGIQMTLVMLVTFISFGDVKTCLSVWKLFTKGWLINIDNISPKDYLLIASCQFDRLPLAAQLLFISFLLWRVWDAPTSSWIQLAPSLVLLFC